MNSPSSSRIHTALKKNRVLFSVYASTSALTFGIIAYDKQLDKSKSQIIQTKQTNCPGLIISEKVLHCLELFGGWPGSIAAQYLLSHQACQNSQYQHTLWSIVCAHLALFAIGPSRLRANCPKIVKPSNPFQSKLSQNNHPQSKIETLAQKDIPNSGKI